MIPITDAMKAQAAPYRKVISWSDDDDCFYVEIPDLPGLLASGDTEEAALRDAILLVDEWYVHNAEFELPPPPEPTKPAPASGRFNVRIPRSLHLRLQQLAEADGVSLNTLVVSLLAQREAERRSRHDGV